MLKTPCNLITGFLGSGKTTLLKNVMERGLSGKRVAIIMNEIGDIGIDGKVITDLDGVEKMVELNSGCVCCTIDQFSFQMAFQEIQEEIKPDLIIIETTGLADPFPILHRLESVRVALDSVITLVDASNFLRLAAEEDVLDEQVKAADFLVLNKTDLVDKSEIDKVEHQLRYLNQRALLIKANHGNVETDLLFSTGVSEYRDRANHSTIPVGHTHTVSNPDQEHHHHHGKDEIQSFSHKTQSSVDLHEFEQFLGALPSNIYRAKGFLNSVNRSTGLLFNFTCGRFDFQEVSPHLGKKLPTQAVFIGRNIHDYQNELIRQFQTCERPTSGCV